MHGIAVTLLTEDKERLMVLQQRLESTQMGRNVFGHVGFPTSPTDAILRQIQDVHADVVLVDIDPQNIQRAMHAIELIHSNTSEIVIFAVGPMTDPGTIVSAMRAGAREYMERNATPESMVDARIDARPRCARRVGDCGKEAGGGCMALPSICVPVADPAAARCRACLIRTQDRIAGRAMRGVVAGLPWHPRMDLVRYGPVLAERAVQEKAKPHVVLVHGRAMEPRSICQGALSCQRPCRHGCKKGVTQT